MTDCIEDVEDFELWVNLLKVHSPAATASQPIESRLHLRQT